MGREMQIKHLQLFALSENHKFEQIYSKELWAKHATVSP